MDPLLALIAATAARTQGLATHRGLLRNGVSRASLSRAVAAGSVVRVRRRVYSLTPLPNLPGYVVTETGVSPDYVVHVRAVLLSLGARTAACRRTAAACYGWGLLVEPGRTVEVATDHGRGEVRALGVSAWQRRSAAVARRRVLPGTAPLLLTTPVQTVLDCALALPLLEAVVVADSALRAGDVTLDELSRAAASLGGQAGARRARRVVEMCDPESGSVLESVLRVRMLLAGCTKFASQLDLRDLPGQHLRVDFCFEEAGLVVEVDGVKWHPDPARDQARDNALATLGWRVLRYCWAEVVHDHARVVAEIQAAVTCGTPTIQPRAGNRSAAA
jgi:very-short-patch-repair endonuclease